MTNLRSKLIPNTRTRTRAPRRSAKVPSVFDTLVPTLPATFNVSHTGVCPAAFRFFKPIAPLIAAVSSFTTTSAPTFYNSLALYSTISISMATITSLSTTFLGIDNDTSPVPLPDWQGVFVLSLVAGFILLVSVLAYISPPPQKNYRLVLVTITGALDINVGPINPDTVILGDYDASFDEATSALIEESLATGCTASDDTAAHSDNDDDKTLATTTEAPSCEDVADQANASFISSSDTLVNEPPTSPVQASIGESFALAYMCSSLMSFLHYQSLSSSRDTFQSTPRRRRCPRSPDRRFSTTSSWLSRSHRHRRRTSRGGSGGRRSRRERRRRHGMV